jgi:nickel/cobalt tolerance cation efflux system protein
LGFCELFFKQSNRALQNREDSIKQLREAFNKLSEVAPNFGGFISHRMDEVLSGVRSAIAIKIYGSDLAACRRNNFLPHQPMQSIAPLQFHLPLPAQMLSRESTQNG